MRTAFRSTLALSCSAAALMLGCTAPATPPASEPQGGTRGDMPSAAAPVTGSLSSGASRAGGSIAQAPASQPFPTANPGAAPTAPRGEVTRTELYEEVVEIEGARYRMLTVELVFGPRAETPVHIHPGPSTGVVMNGRITVALPGGNRTTTYAAGSPIGHPWNTPHTFANTSDETVRMLSFELIPLR